MQYRKINIGTSGWSYKEWKETFYPGKMKPADYLVYYAQHFDATEINSSFYRLPKASTVIQWTAKVPEHFKFCVKISRYLTHIRKLKEPEESLQRFFNIFEPMKEKMGPVLIQLPPSLSFNYNVAEHFFNVLKTRYNKYDFALEIRHHTWMSEDSVDLMTKYDIAFVISQSGVNFPYAETITSKNVYIRFHGPGALYASSYNDEMLRSFARKLKSWIKKGHYVWAFFNNTMTGDALTNTKALLKMLK